MLFFHSACINNCGLINKNTSHQTPLIHTFLRIYNHFYIYSRVILEFHRQEEFHPTEAHGSYRLQHE